MMKKRKYIVDTTLRDGEQCPGIAMTPDQKLKIAALLENADVFQIEAGTPVIGGREVEAIGMIVDQRTKVKVSTWNRMNKKDILMSFECHPDIIHISAPVSYAQIYTKLQKNKVWLTKNLLEMVDLARSKGYEVTVGFEDASRADIGFMASLATQLQKLEVSRIRFADTVGVMMPSTTEQMIKCISDYSQMNLEFHAHNDFGMAIPNSVLAAKHGADYIDTTILGIGERAGNCHFEKFVNVAEKIFDLGLNWTQALSIEQSTYDLLKDHLPFS